MKRSGKIKLGNLWVGIIVTFAMAALLYSSFRGGGTSIFEKKDELVVYFGNVNGLVRGAPVWLGGVEVGNVRSIKFVNLDEKRRIKAVISVKKSVWESITTDSRIMLGTIGLLGDKYIEVIPGTKGLPVVEPGTVLPTVEETGLNAVLTKAPKFVAAIDSTLTNLKDITRALVHGEGTAGKLLSDTALYNQLVTALEQTSSVISEVKENQKKIIDAIGTTFDNTASMTSGMEAGEGSLGKLIKDESLYNSLTLSAARIDSILARLDRGDGSAGALLNDDRLYEEISNLVVRINNLVADIEKNPRKYFKFSVF